MQVIHYGIIRFITSDDEQQPYWGRNQPRDQHGRRERGILFGGVLPLSYITTDYIRSGDIHTSVVHRIVNIQMITSRAGNNQQSYLCQDGIK